MSRTNKTDPYWVRVSREGVYRQANHHHERFGAEIAEHHVLRGKDGEALREQIPIYQKARIAVNTMPKLLVSTEDYRSFGSTSNLRYITNWMTHKVYALNPAYQRAFDLVAEGHGEEDVIVRYVSRVRTRKIVTGHVKDYCTVNEEWDGSWWGVQPCWKDLPAGYHYPGQRSSWDSATRKADRGGLRARTLSSGRNLAKAYNNGFDLDDFERDAVSISEKDRYNRW